MVAVYLRTRLRADRMPPADQFAAAGVEAVVWTPAGWADVVATLAGPDNTLTSAPSAQAGEAASVVGSDAAGSGAA